MRRRTLVLNVTIALLICASAMLSVQSGPQAVGVELDSDGAQHAEQGQQISYDHTINNIGTKTETFQVDVLSTEAWPVELLSEQHLTKTEVFTLELGPQMSTALQVNLTVPVHSAGVMETAWIGATTQLGYSVQDTAVITTYLPTSVYLPLVVNRWPPIPNTPVLSPIDNPDGDGNYDVSWEASYLADAYVLQEDDNTSFSSPSITYSGSGTSDYISGQTPGTYYYRVKATNNWGDSGWSNVQDVTVLPPKTEVYVENDTGSKLCYEIFDTSIGEKCFSSGTHFYGSFPSGTYDWHVSARCGSASGQESYPAGKFTHRFWCK